MYIHISCMQNTCDKIRSNISCQSLLCSLSHSPCGFWNINQGCVRGACDCWYYLSHYCCCCQPVANVNRVLSLKITSVKLKWILSCGRSSRYLATIIIKTFPDYLLKNSIHYTQFMFTTAEEMKKQLLYSQSKCKILAKLP